MRRESRVELEARLRDIGRDADLRNAGLQAVVNGEVEWIGRMREEETRFRFGVAELDRAHGGLFLISTRVLQADRKWDRAYTVVRYLDDIYAKAQRSGAAAYARYAEWIGRARAMREAIYVKAPYVDGRAADREAEREEVRRDPI